VTLLLLLLLPPPQVALQVLHEVHWLTLQSTGQVVVPHSSDSVSPGHSIPPLAERTSTSLSLLLLPPPQVAVQVLQEPHWLNLQSTEQSSVLHTSTSNSPGHSCPPLVGGVSTALSLCRPPPPQVALQVVHGLHWLTLQSTEQGAVPHSSNSVSPGHSLPPPADWTSTVLPLLLLPPPQVALQVVQGLHWLTLQSTGHVVVPHSSDSVSPGHSCPPLAGGVSTALPLCLLPLPQVALQAVQGLHWLTLQSTGHVVVPHSSDSVSPGHSCPPLAGGVSTALPLCLLPLPQGHRATVQAVQGLHWLTQQSTGHVVVPQSSDSVRPGHSCPSLVGGVSTALPLCHLPPPQVALQVVQGLHWLTMQSTGQVSVPHSSDTVSSGHSLPPLAVRTSTALSLLLLPPPQVALQVLQEPQWLTLQSTGQVL